MPMKHALAENKNNWFGPFSFIPSLGRVIKFLSNKI